jgi:hypothetical protein
MAVIIRSETSIDRIRGSFFSSAAVLTPSLQNQVAIHQYNIANPAQLGVRKLHIEGKT